MTSGEDRAKATDRFKKDFAALSDEAKTRFRDKIQGSLIPFVDDARPLHAGLRVKGVHGAPGVYEMTWAPDGRATFQYGDPRVEGLAHIIWRRIGTHDIVDSP